MAISDLLTKLSTDITNAYNAIEAKGGTIPTNKNTENLVDAINSISGGPAPVDDNTLLLLHLDNDYGDSSNYERTPSSATGLNYVAGKFNTYGLSVLNQSQGIISYSTLFDLPTHDFTVDFWFNPNSFSASGSGNGRPIMGNFARNNWECRWVIFVSQYQGNTKKWGFNWNDGTNQFLVVSTTELTANTWSHLAVTYEKSTRTMCLYINGVKDKEQVATFEMTGPGPSQPQTFSVGNWMSNYNYAPLGYIDEVRISDVIRYDGNFTPPTQPY